MSDKQVADAESKFLVVNITPDFCKVGNQIVPFDICQVLESEKGFFSPDVLARGAKVLTAGSVVRGTKGNAGQGVFSAVAGANGHAVILEGDPTVLVNGNPIARHLDLVAMNAKV